MSRGWLAAQIWLCTVAARTGRESHMEIELERQSFWSTTCSNQPSFHAFPPTDGRIKSGRCLCKRVRLSGELSMTKSSGVGQAPLLLPTVAPSPNWTINIRPASPIILTVLTLTMTQHADTFSNSPNRNLVFSPPWSELALPPSLAEQDASRRRHRPRSRRSSTGCPQTPRKACTPLPGEYFENPYFYRGQALW